MLSHSALMSGLAPQSRTALGITVTCGVDCEDTKDTATDHDDDDCGNDDYDHDQDNDDHDYYDHDDHDDAYLTCIDSEPVKHLCQLASLLLKLICLQLQR